MGLGLKMGNIYMIDILFFVFGFSVLVGLLIPGPDASEYITYRNEKNEKK